MSSWAYRNRYQLRILETPAELTAVEHLQRVVWPGDESAIVPSHMLLAAAHNGGLVVGAFEVEPSSEEDQPPAEEDFTVPSRLQTSPQAPLVGFVFGFPGLYFTPDGPRPKHCSHMLGVLPEHRDFGVGFALKRAQWQMVRHQGLDRITWTYDPLLSRNAHLNIARLGSVCNTYIEEAYGQMLNGLNVGLPSDRFQVDWWISSQRVFQRLSKKPRTRLDLAHFLAAGTVIVNPTHMGEGGWPCPPPNLTQVDNVAPSGAPGQPETSLVLVEIPADFLALKAADPQLALHWRLHTRDLFQDLFRRGYLVTDFVHLPGNYSRSFYVLSYGESTL
jgi:predicted GNAT superfamily acetyltransferase